MTPYIPHTDDDRRKMLAAIGISSIDQLFADIPEEVRPEPSLFSQKGLSEAETFAHLAALAATNKMMVPFMGLGSYDRLIPAAVKALASLPAFVTAYTPYQPEISQGLLQAIFEYQSMICELTGMEVSNASLYDGNSAAAEAAAMMLSSKRKSTTILISSTVHPFMLDVVHTWAMGTGFVIKEVNVSDGSFSIDSLDWLIDDSVAGLIVQSPNRYGVVEDYTGVADLLHRHKAMLAISSDPLSLALYSSQAEWDADIAFGDTQPLGLPMSFGGPSCGYIAVHKELMRKMPGRIVGQTLDNRGNRAFVLTLQAREQHIKRERATSNICSNQALAALTTTIHLSMIGWQGMVEAANQSLAKAHYLASELTALPHVHLAWDKPFWCEFTLRLEHPELIDKLLNALADQHMLGGVKLSRLTNDSENDALLVVAVTEKRTEEQLRCYIETARRVLA